MADPNNRLPDRSEPNEGGLSGRTASSVNDAVKHVGASSVTFLLTLSFLGVTTFSITHTHLLIGHQVKLPLLDVEVPVVEFFVLAPAMVLLFHLVFLIQVYLLAREARALGSKAGDAGARTDGAAGEGGDASAPVSSPSVTTRSAQDVVRLPTIFAQVFNPGVSTQRVPLWLTLRGLLGLILVFLPLGLLGLMQWRFVPYHDPEITFWHQSLVTADLLLCFALVPLVLAREDHWTAWWRRGWMGQGPRFVTRSLFVLALTIGLLLTWFIAVVPGTLLEALWGRRLELADCLLPRDLHVAGIDVDPTGRVAWEADPEAEWQPECPLARPTLDLSDRDLRGADLSQSVLRGVDFRGADLGEARLVRADLRCADLSPLGATELVEAQDEGRWHAAAGLGGDGVERTVLRGSDLTGADLRGAGLVLADLRSADLSGADARGVEAIRADLRGALLRGTRLASADLSYARLDSSVLEGGGATCVVLYGASARGVWGVGLKAAGSDLRNADLRGSALSESVLDAADLSGARIGGSDLRAARLPEATGLDLEALDLRWAELGGSTAANRSPLGRRSPEIDARGITYKGMTGPSLVEVESEIGEAKAALKWVHRAVRRLGECEGRVETNIARGKATVGGVLVLQPGTRSTEETLGELPFVLDDRVFREGTAPGAPATTPRLLATEDDLQLRLADSLVTQACLEPPVAALLVLRARGCLAPRDPVLERRIWNRLSAQRQRLNPCPGVDEALHVTESLAPARSAGERSVNRGMTREPLLETDLPSRACVLLKQNLLKLTLEAP